MSLARTILKDVQAYVPGEQPQDSGIIKLNTNENPYPPSPRVMDTIRNLDASQVARYPDPVATRLRELAAKRYGFDSVEWVFAGNGMDEVLAMTMRAFVDPGETVLSTWPTYILYETLAQLHGAKYVQRDLDDAYQWPKDFAASSAQVCFVTRPNAPSGVCAPRAAMEKLCADFNGVVLIDEAYADFANDSCIDFPKHFDNVVVARTFSKSFSLAGLRLGLAFARPELIAEFMKTKDSYNLNAATQAAGCAALEDYAHMQSNVARIGATRTRLIAALRGKGFDVPESQANYVLAGCGGTLAAATLMPELKARNIYVRHFRARGLDNALRISVGSDEEIDALLAALDTILK